MLKLFLWLKYLRKRKIVLLSVVAVALSVALLVVVASLFSGFIEAVEQTGQEAFGDIYLNPLLHVPQYPELIEQLESLDQIEAVTAVIDTYGLLRLGPGDVKPIRILGIDPGRYTKVANLKNSLLTSKNIPGEPNFAPTDSTQIVAGFVSIGVLGKPDEKTDEYDFDQATDWIGKKVVLTTGAVTGQSQTKVRTKKLKFEIADVVFTGMYINDTSDVYLPIATVRKLIGLNSDQRGPGEEFRIKLAQGVDPDLMLGVVRQVWEQFAIKKGLPRYYVNKPLLGTARQMQGRFVDELNKQMLVLMVIFGVICSVAVLLIFCIFYMIVMTRQKDIAVIKSCGAGSGTLWSVFTGFGACVGIVGSCIGIGLGYIVISNINIIEKWISKVSGIKLWKSSTYIFERIPNQLHMGWCWRIAALAVVAAMIGALIPAIVAARTKPVEILRYE